VQDLGSHNALILRNHGLLTCGPTVPEAFNLIYQLEQACRAQVDVMAAGATMITPDEDTLVHTAKLYQPGTRRPYGILEWPAMRRLLEHEPAGSWPRYDS
jgi:ribulose-5-phosphate 4-epimerase/fuculose-1-phosphate aldolase